MKIVLVSTYELGHQPFGLASAQAWLKHEGHLVSCTDLAVEKFAAAKFRDADMVAFYLPMHTATRLALPVIERVRAVNPRARLVGFGLYAAAAGIEAVSGEFEAGLVKLARGETAPEVSLERLKFLTPDRSGLPDLARYAKLRQNGATKVAGYTESSRGCKHTCRHCPVVPVYQGQFRVVQREVVLEDIRQQVSAGAQHITFGDPDFFNGPRHAMQIVEALHAEFPSVTYDATIKIEHLRKHSDLLLPLKETGCLFVTSAVESLDDRVLEKLVKNHTRADFFGVAAAMREAGLPLQPTFIAFTPWTTLESYRELLSVLKDLELVENVAPIQLALRLLVTPGSRLLELEEFPAAGPWKHPDPRVDELGERVFRLIAQEPKPSRSRAQIFSDIWNLAQDERLPENFHLLPRAAIPYLDEPWYC